MKNVKNNGKHDYKLCGICDQRIGWLQSVRLLAGFLTTAAANFENCGSPGGEKDVIRSVGRFRGNAL